MLLHASTLVVTKPRKNQFHLSKMINILALALLVSSLAAAGVWSPLPDPTHGDRTVREGHRVIVVEYEREIPYQPPPKFQGLSSPESTESAQPTPTPTPAHSAKEVVCDAYGACKEKLSHIFAKSKDEASNLKHEAEDAVIKTKEFVEEGKDKAKDAIKDTIKGGKDAASNVSAAAEKTAAGVINRNISDIVRRAKVVAGDAAKYVGVRGKTARAAGSAAHLLGFAVAYGTGFWVTFVSSYVLATALPRQQFGMVQSKIYPVYFRAMAYGIGLAAATQWFGKGRAVGAERLQGYNLVAALGLVLVNMLYLEPKATKVMFERIKMEKEEGRGRDIADVMAEPVMTSSTATTTTTTTTASPAPTQSVKATYGVRTSTTKTAAAAADQVEAIKSRAAKLSKRLKKLNTYSSVLNVLCLMGLTWHLVHLAGQMQAAAC